MSKTASHDAGVPMKIQCENQIEIKREIAWGGGGTSSHTPAHKSTATVAPFRAWRSSQFIIAGGPEATIMG